MYLNDIEETFILSGIEGIDVGSLKLFLLLYTEDIVLFVRSAEDLQKSLDVLAEYCLKWKLTVNTNKTKIIIFRNGGRLPRNIHFSYSGENRNC